MWTPNPPARLFMPGVIIYLRPCYTGTGSVPTSHLSLLVFPWASPCPCRDPVMKTDVPAMAVERQPPALQHHSEDGVGGVMRQR